MKISKLARNTVMGVVCASFVAMGGCSSIKNTWNSMTRQARVLLPAALSALL